METVATGQEIGFVRFAIRSCSAITGKPRGIFCGLWHLQNRAVMTPEELQLSKDLVSWFEENLPNPPTYNYDWGKAATSWFKLPVPGDMLARLQSMKDLLEKYSEPVDRIEACMPEGNVIFEDEFQIVVMDQAPQQ